MHRISEDTFSANLDHLKLREFIVAAILEKNPLLIYENIYINKNYILKLKGEAFYNVDEAVLWTQRVINSSYLVRKDRD